MADSQWLTWEQAADLVGCPVPTIDWHKRAGRIRSRHQRPSLERASVEEFARWWRKRRDDREARRALAQSRNPRRPPEPTGWLSTDQAAEVMGCTTRNVARLAQNGALEATRSGGRLWLRETDVANFVAHRDHWISHAAAASIAGCSPSTIHRAVAHGAIMARQVSAPARPSLSRTSVQEFAADLALRRQHTAQARADAEDRRPASGPPDDGDVWLDAGTTALVLGISTTRLGQLAPAGRVPHQVRGRRRWYRRGDIERLAAARAGALAATAAQTAPHPRSGTRTGSSQGSRNSTAPSTFTTQTSTSSRT